MIFIPTAMKKLSVQSEEESKGTGPRWVSGKILARSILGDPEDFEALSREQTRVIRMSDTPSTPGTPTTGGFETMINVNSQPKNAPLNDDVIQDVDKEAEIRQALATLSESKRKDLEEKIKKIKSLHIFQVKLIYSVYNLIMSHLTLLSDMMRFGNLEY